MAALLFLTPAAAAEFRYVAPAAPRPSFVALQPDDPHALGQTLRRLLPPEVTLRFDRRVPADRHLTHRYADWRSLLWGEGLAHDRHGDEIHVRPAGIAAGEVELAERGSSVWQLQAGETLRDALRRWGERANVAVVFLTDLNWRLHHDRTFRGTFREAARALLFGLSHMPHPPAAELSADGATLAVMHRGDRK